MREKQRDRVDYRPLESPAVSVIMLVILMFVAAAIAGCSAPIEGKVIGKDVDPGRTELYWTTERRSCGIESYTTSQTVDGKTKTTTKTRTKYCDNRVQRSRNVPPSWDLNIQADDGEQRWVSVSRSAYEKVQIGDRVNTANLR